MEKIFKVLKLSSIEQFGIPRNASKKKERDRILSFKNKYLNIVKHNNKLRFCGHMGMGQTQLNFIFFPSKKDILHSSKKPALLLLALTGKLGRSGLM